MSPEGCAQCATFQGCVQVLRRLADQLAEADEAFESCDRAAAENLGGELHRQVRERITWELAKGVIAEQHHLDLDEAGTFVEELARAAGMPAARATRLLIAGHPLAP